MKTLKALCASITIMFSCGHAFAANNQSDIDPESVGKIPTYHYSVPAEYMFELLMMDIKDGRRPLSKAKPSYLDSFIVRTENVPDGIRGGAFANNTSLLICLTIINLTVSNKNSSVQGNSNMVARNCAPGSPDLWATWVRNTSTAPITAPGLAQLYSSYGVTMRYNPTSATAGLRGQTFVSSQMMIGQELWGHTFFNGYGSTAIAQEMVLTIANWN